MSKLDTIILSLLLSISLVATLSGAWEIWQIKKLVKELEKEQQQITSIFIGDNE